MALNHFHYLANFAVVSLTHSVPNIWSGWPSRQQSHSRHQRLLCSVHMFVSSPDTTKKFLSVKIEKHRLEDAYMAASFTAAAQCTYLSNQTLPIVWQNKIASTRIPLHTLSIVWELFVPIDLWRREFSSFFLLVPSHPVLFIQTYYTRFLQVIEPISSRW